MDLQQNSRFGLFRSKTIVFRCYFFQQKMGQKLKISA